MIKIISHRGNLIGKTSEENKPSYIKNALLKGFDVEIDVWIIDDKFFLGHDKPEYNIDVNFLLNDKLWCHAKNKKALEVLLKNNIHVFWHENDKFTLTSKGIPWCYPGNYLKSGITVELNYKKKMPEVYGICTDYPLKWI